MTNTATHKVDSIPSDTRGYLHAVTGAAFVVLTTLGLLNDAAAPVIAAVVVAAIDLALVLVYTRDAWRKALYPLLYAGGGVAVLLGTFNEAEVAAILGLVATVLGTQVAAAKTPVIEGTVVK